jgi:hypothetical protein
MKNHGRDWGAVRPMISARTSYRLDNYHCARRAAKIATNNSSPCDNARPQPKAATTASATNSRKARVRPRQFHLALIFNAPTRRVSGRRAGAGHNARGCGGAFLFFKPLPRRLAHDIRPGYVKLLYPWKRHRKQAMRLLFSGRNAKLETMNRILTDAARKRAERIEELETQVTQLERQLAHLKQELEPASKRARELEVVAAQRAELINEKDKQLALVRRPQQMA